ncbi:MAG: carbohydrate binding domain-containing protein [Elusimicrobiota bacterium]
MVKLSKLFGFFIGLALLVSLASAKAPAAKPAAATTKSAVAATVMPENVIDDMSAAPAGWIKERDKGTTITLAAGKGQKGKALEISYSLGDEATWLGVRKKIRRDISKYKGIRFAVRGEGSSNSIEVKLENADYSNFGIVLPVKSNTSEWSDVEIPFADFEYLWGDSNEVNLLKPLIHITIVKKESDDEGGAGKFVIDQIELYK